MLSRAEIAAIGEVCRRHDLWIVSDEVYEELTFGAAFASPFDLPELADRTVVVSSISKSHAAPGFRSGWFRLRNWQKAFVATGDGERLLWLPTSRGFGLLLQPRDPQRLLERLRELAPSPAR